MKCTELLTIPWMNFLMGFDVKRFVCLTNSIEKMKRTLANRHPQCVPNVIWEEIRSGKKHFEGFDIGTYDYQSMV